MSEPEIDWTARRCRALAHLEALKHEWERAREKRQRPRYIAYDYRESERKDDDDETV